MLGKKCIEPLYVDVIKTNKKRFCETLSKRSKNVLEKRPVTVSYGPLKNQ
jgi:hypothetical protein